MMNMKKVIRLSTALTALAAFGSAAHAGFLDPPPAYPVPPPGYPSPGYPVKSALPPPAVYDWTGFYVGINGGGSWGRVPWSSDPDGVADTTTVSGGLVGGTMGYNAQNLGRFVVGGEFDFDWRSFNATIPAPVCVSGGANCEFKSDWLSTARLRFGYAFDRFLPYVTAGVSISNISQDIAGQPLGVADSVSFNWTAGAGLEFVVSGPLTAKLEYLYVNHTNTACNAECGGGPIHMGLNENIFRVGLNYRLWSR
jgi:outer membrane immunogenic protein